MEAEAGRADDAPLDLLPRVDGKRSSHHPCRIINMTSSPEIRLSERDPAQACFDAGTQVDDDWWLLLVAPAGRNSAQAAASQSGCTENGGPRGLSAARPQRRLPGPTIQVARPSPSEDRW